MLLYYDFIFCISHFSYLWYFYPERSCDNYDIKRWLPATEENSNIDKNNAIYWCKSKSFSRQPDTLT